MLIGQLWTNTVSYSYWMIDSESVLIELCNFGENESDDDNKKQKLDKIKMDLYSLNTNNSSIITIILHLDDFLFLDHLEVTTPPPEPFLFLS